MSLNFHNSFIKLPDNFYSKVAPEKTKKPKKILINNDLCRDFNLKYDYLCSDEGINLLSGNFVPKGAEPLAMVYAGHQFGHWVPQLGDGRAVLLGEILNRRGEKFDIQLKGSGKTPYSRNGDGKAWLGPAIREYLVSEYMHNINIPTTRSLSVVLTGDDVFREQVYPGAVLCRLAKSHIRVGTFQYFHARKDYKSLKLLADYLINKNFPYIENDENKYITLFSNIVDGQVKLVSKWMEVGFIHGVMNTDNTSLTCETIDYGPCAFIDIYKGDKVFSSIDHSGRYSYKNQPNIIMWNMACLASTILNLMSGKKEKNIKKFENIIANIPLLYKDYWLSGFKSKLGLSKNDDKDELIINRFLKILEVEELDFTVSFSKLKNLIENQKIDVISKSSTFITWKEMWLKRLQKEEDQKKVKSKLVKSNPQIIARNHIIEKIIEDLLNGKKETLENFIEAISTPFEKNYRYEDFYLSPNKEEVVSKTFCGT